MPQETHDLIDKTLVGVVIPTVGRQQAIRRIFDSLCNQSLPPTVIAICSPEPSDIPSEIADHPLTVTSHGVRGASAQRNMAIASLPANVTHIAFFDDDTVLRSDYLERAVAGLALGTENVGLTGCVIRDGVAEGRELSGDEIAQSLTASWANEDLAVTPVDRLYGMNMVVRADAAASTPFDERLPLYSWLEDLDFSRRLNRLGTLVYASGAICVHQGNISGGRAQHRRVGYSQVSNYLYLRRKGSVNWRDGSYLVLRPLIATMVKSLAGSERTQRRARLLGMGMAFADAARGRVTPERITEMQI